MSVKGYHCTECGFKNNCDISNGERICKDCGEWVSGVTGEFRKGKEIHGEITWFVAFSGDVRPSYNVKAHDFEHAVEKAGELNNNYVTKVIPR